MLCAYRVPIVGDFVLCEYKGEWSRAEVVQAVNLQFVVAFVDYGNLEVVQQDKLLHLPRHFSHIPAVAAKTQIYHVADSPVPELKEKSMDIMKVGAILLY